MKIEITNYQAKLLWSVCNQAQHRGLHDNAILMERMKDKLPNSWVNENIQEYDNLQMIKNKLHQELLKND